MGRFRLDVLKKKKFTLRVVSQWNRFLHMFKRHVKLVLGDVGYWVRGCSAGLDGMILSLPTMAIP